jgi:hypothetical protein
MKRSSAVRFVLWLSAAFAAFGCAQIAGVSGDYHLGMGGEAGSSNTDAGSMNAGAMSADAGSSSADAGSMGADAGSSSGGASAGDSGAGAAGASLSGAGGAVAAGPVRIGFSEFHDSASGGDNASSHLANATFQKPAGTAAGDFILVFFGCDHELQHLSGAYLDAAGWTLLDQHENYGGDGQGTYLIYKFAGANEPTSYVFEGINNAPSGNGVQGLLSVYRGVNATDPINDYAALVVAKGAESVTEVVTPTPAVKTTVADCLLIAGLSPDSAVDAPVITSWPDGFGENQVSVINPAHPYPNGWANIYSAERHVAAAAEVPASAFGWDITGDNHQYYGTLAFVLALAPAP